jgi:Undecaprenyl-phosphate galactose phosphotransferase WbaP
MATALVMHGAATETRQRPCFTGSVMAASDLAAIAGTIALAVMVRQIFRGNFDLGVYWRLWPLLGLFPAAYALFGLYPGVVLSPVAELRTTSYATTLVFLVLGALTFLLRNPGAYSRLAFFGAWVACLVVVPLLRSMIRAAVADQPWWGYRVVVLGATGSGEAILRKLARHPEIGLRPAAVFDDNVPRGTVVHGIVVRGPISSAPAFAKGANITRAIVALQDVPMPDMVALLDMHAQTFSRVFMVPKLHGLSSIGVETRDLNRVLALEMRKNLLMAGPRTAKRLLDLAFSLLLLVCLSPLLALIALLTKLESPGKVLYRQSRIGLDCEKFWVWKFRTMRVNSEQMLAGHLAKNPEAAEEWRSGQKLKNDPRVTRLGRILRKASLDELPQLVNVVRGEMSMVGPRPIVDSEIQKYGSAFALYRQVIPGLTGLWQVSGRNLRSYDERVELDTYYVRNWSPWLDIYLLARTIKVVVTGYGAY